MSPGSFSVLHSDLCFMITSYLGFADLRNLALTCKAFKNIARRSLPGLVNHIAARLDGDEVWYLGRKFALERRKRLKNEGEKRRRALREALDSKYHERDSGTCSVHPCLAPSASTCQACSGLLCSYHAVEWTCVVCISVRSCQSCSVRRFKCYHCEGTCCVRHTALEYAGQCYCTLCAAYSLG